MSNCLGIFVENNVIKYAKLNTDKNGSPSKLVSYGVRFGDNTKDLVDQIVRETNSANDIIATNIIGEKYEDVEVFSRLNKKDIKGLVVSEYASLCSQKGVLSSVLDMKYKLVKNTGDPDKYKAICVATDKIELTNIFRYFSDCKISNIHPLGTSIVNILPNKGIEEQAVIVNIEDETTVTIITKGEVADITSFPVGMKDVLPKLSEKYNSYAKAYEACKEVSAYIEDAYALEDANRDILDLLIPMLYDLRSRVEGFVKPYLPIVNKIYLTGTGIIINNLDLYFQEVFTDKTCQILVPYFLSKESNNLKDIVEVNTAVALAFNGLGYGEKDIDYASGQFENMAQSEMLKKKFEEAKKKAIEFYDKYIKSGKPKKKSAKRKVEFNDEVVETSDGMPPMVEYGENISTAEEDDDENTSYLSPMDWLLLRTTGVALLAFCVYSGAALYTNNEISKKQEEIDSNKAAINGWITEAKTDTTNINGESNKYETMKLNLQELVNKVTVRTVNFDIQNFLSKLMFTMPENVKVTSIDVDDAGSVIMNAESGQYAQLGYFVSRLKLDNVLSNVDMNVVSMSNNIKIKVSGELP